MKAFNASPPSMNSAASPSVPTGMISMPLTSPASAALACGRTTRPMPRRCRPMTMGSTPSQGCTRPSSVSSPKNAVLDRSPRHRTDSDASSTPMAIGRSKWLPSFFLFAGVRFTVIRLSGNLCPPLRIADRIRSFASRMAWSASPTIKKPGSPLSTSVSTQVGSPDRP